MPASQANPGFGVKFLTGDGGVGGGAKASRTIGTSNQQVKYEAKSAGTAGNAISVAQLGGLSQVLGITVVGTVITVQLATDGSSVVTSTASDVIDLINSDAAASALVLATNGTGNGSGLAVAGAAATLSGGTAATEVFTELAEVVGIPGFGVTHRTDEVTHMSSPGGWAEYIGLGVKEGKSFTIPLNFVANAAAQIALFKTKAEAGTTNNYRIQFTDDLSSYVTFAAIVTETDISHERDSKADLSITFQPTGPYTWAP